jgi:hypothetical protein
MPLNGAMYTSINSPLNPKANPERLREANKAYPKGTLCNAKFEPPRLGPRHGGENREHPETRRNKTKLLCVLELRNEKNLTPS